MISKSGFILLVALSSFASTTYLFVDGALSQDDEQEYLNKFSKIVASSYSQVDDMSNANSQKPPNSLDQCRNSGHSNPTREVTVTGKGTASASHVQSVCGKDSICIIPDGLTLRMDTNLNLGALIVRGGLEWTTDSQSSSNQFLCGGYVVIEDNGSFEMDLNSEDDTKTGWIYIKNNGAVHPELRSRSFGTFKDRNSNDNPTMTIRGRKLTRTWSLLSMPLVPGDTTMTLMHDPVEMGWREGDRLGISPTESLAEGWGQDVVIQEIRNDGTVVLMSSINNYHRADFETSSINGNAALLSAEVVNLSRNIILTGDDFEEVPCDPTLPEAVIGEETSVLGCKCSSFRSKCHVGLHSMQNGGGVTKIEDIRVEKCGQRGIEGKYCLHFHKADECPECIYRNNAIENSQQRGIIVHDTHLSTVENNVLYNVRGANVYLEDGNEMWNTLAYNVAICPFPFRDDDYHGCTIPGTSNFDADTSLNQSGFWSRAGTNNFIGNRASNHFDGMFLKEGLHGRGEANGKVCESASILGRMEGNTWHGNGRFGTYTLGNTYPKETDQSSANHGYNTDKSLCEIFDSNGDTRGSPGAFFNHVDYGNAFVGHYNAGDLQHSGHYSTENNELMYWKETKTFENGCGAHIVNGYYSKGNIALPDQSTFIIENTIMGEDVKMEANHHCNVGTTGFLCMPTYVLHKVQWKNENKDKTWARFQDHNTQPHNNNQNHGGIFTLSPEDAAVVEEGFDLPDSFFPKGYVSLVSDKFSYLLGLPNNVCIDSSEEYGDRYNGGILCKTQLRALKVYTRGLHIGSAPELKVEVWYNGNEGSPLSSQLIGFHQIGKDGKNTKQGYSFPVIPYYSYRISLTSGDLPKDWVIEFSDPVIGNRWSNDEIYLSVAGRDCGNNGLVSSQHDRKYIWGGQDGGPADEAWGHHGACVGSGNQPPDETPVDCSSDDNNRNLQGSSKADMAGVIEPTQCPGDCPGGCDNSNSYCDCGTKTCRCKAGFSGPNCEVDVCASANCGEHGSCSALYLGGDLPVDNTQCICEEGWRGIHCDKSPCEELGLQCANGGSCVALSDTEATCQCEDGFFGPNCEERSPCENFCEGSFPYFGCGSNHAGKVALGCHENGGCHYLAEGEEYPYDGFCTYKTYGINTVFSTQDLPNIAPNIAPTNAPVTAPTRAPTKTPTNKPTKKPTKAPIKSPTKAPTNKPTKKPIKAPTKAPTDAPTSKQNNDGAVHCGCSTCTDEVWNRLADGFSCGARISWVRDSDASTLESAGLTKGPYNEAEACAIVTDEFGDVCPCSCSDETDNSAPTKAPVSKPTKNPTMAPTAGPTNEPTLAPVSKPTKNPTANPTSIPTSIAPVDSPVDSPTTKRVRKCNNSRAQFTLPEDKKFNPFKRCPDVDKDSPEARECFIVRGKKVKETGKFNPYKFSCDHFKKSLNRGTQRRLCRKKVVISGRSARIGKSLRINAICQQACKNVQSGTSACTRKKKKPTN